MKKIITILLIAAIAATSAITLTACGSAGKTAPTTAAPTAAPTVAATVVATQAEPQKTTPATTQSYRSSDVSEDINYFDASNANDYSEAEYAGITRQKAIDSVLESYDDSDGVIILEAYQGTYPAQGWDAWVVTAQDSNDVTRTFYCGFAFCIPQSRYDMNDGTDTIGISQQEAVDNVEERIGDFDKITNVEKGETSEGWSCWVLTVEHMDGSTDIYYCGYLFCYPAE